MPQTLSQQDLRILIIGGIGSAGNVLAGALNASGYPHTMVLHSAERAMAALQTKRYDIFLIFLDQQKDNGFDLIRKIRLGQTRAPKDQLLLLIEPEYFDRDEAPSDFNLAELAINAIARMPLTPAILDEAIKHALSHPYLSQVREELIEQQQAESVKLPPGFVETPFDLPVGAMTIGMYLAQDVTIHGHTLVPAGTLLTEIHLQALENLEAVLEDQEFTVYLKPSH